MKYFPGKNCISGCTLKRRIGNYQKYSVDYQLICYNPTEGLFKVTYSHVR